MKQSYVKTAEEAIKKAEAVQYRFLTQEEFGSGQVPDSVWEAGALEEQLDSLHRIARIDQEKAAGKLKERLCGVKRAKSRRLPDTPARQWRLRRLRRQFWLECACIRGLGTGRGILLRAPMSGRRK